MCKNLTRLNPLNLLTNLRKQHFVCKKYVFKMFVCKHLIDATQKQR